jgi:hypothetical protein
MWLTSMAMKQATFDHAPVVYHQVRLLFKAAVYSFHLRLSMPLSLPGFDPATLHVLL